MSLEVCSFCKGELVKGQKEFVSKVGEQIIAIKDVFVYICENFGETTILQKFQGKFIYF
jgi:YgiT-type zinc finger domain-containing protein